MKSATRYCQQQRGATLIEVLVAVLILSFGLLSLGAMLSYAVQLPKLSGHRMIATNIASDHIERCLLYTSPSPRDRTRSRMPSSA